MAKLGEKLHQLEMAIGEFSLQQVYQFQTMSCIPPPPHLMKVKVREGTNKERKSDMSQLLLLGKFEYGGGPIFKVVLEC